MIATVTLNPAVDHQVFVDRLELHDTNRVIKTEVDAGGKGINLSRVYAELGGRTLATGFIGGSAGMFIRQVLDRQGVECDFVEVTGATRLNISIEDSSGLPPTTFNERGPHILASEYDALVAKVKKYAALSKWICLGGSLPPGLPTDTYAHLAGIAKAEGCRVMLDADKEPCLHGLTARPHFIKPNQPEAGRILGREVATTEQAINAARDLRERLAPDGMVVVSRGAEGAILACKEGVFVGQSAPVEAKSTIGSGDSFLGGMLWGMEESGCGIEDAFRWGLAAGAATAITDGTEIARKSVCDLLFAHTSVQRV